MRKLLLILLLLGILHPVRTAQTKPITHGEWFKMYLCSKGYTPDLKGSRKMWEDYENK
ncbi:hypothetical protein OAH77_04555 [Flavobacteriaceae bacterium]|nr:hypothetical protein [Flavobacteriaceae bacterium]